MCFPLDVKADQYYNLACPALNVSPLILALSDPGHAEYMRLTWAVRSRNPKTNPFQRQKNLALFRRNTPFDCLRISCSEGAHSAQKKVSANNSKIDQRPCANLFCQSACN